MAFSLCSAFLFASGAWADEQKPFRDIKMAPDRDLASEARGELRIDAREVADLLEIAPMVERLRALQKSPASDTHRSRAVQTMRLLCLWKIFIAAEEVRKVVAQIDYDLAVSNQGLDELSARKNSITNNINSVNFMQGGILGIIKNCISLPGRYNNPHIAQEIAIVNFSNGIALSMTNMFIVPRLINRKVDAKANMLAHIFSPTYRPADAQQSYLWKFFNAPIPRSQNGLTRREILIKHWEAFDGLRSSDEKNLTLLSALNPSEKVLHENMRVVNQRIDLLQDMKTHIEEFDASLFELHKAITLD